MKLNLDNIEQDTYKTQKSQTKLQTKGRKIQKETKGSGFKDTMKVWGLLNKLQVPRQGFQLWVSRVRVLVRHLGVWGENQNLTRLPSDSFQVQTSKYYPLSSMQRWMKEKSNTESLTEWQALCSTNRKRRRMRRGEKVRAHGAQVWEQQEPLPDQRPAWRGLPQEAELPGRGTRSRRATIPRGNKRLLPVWPQV